jgi:NAD(P)-dependent dehydrogenase (short-subunit alcohol dehydrogenase family)
MEIIIIAGSEGLLGSRLRDAFLTEQDIIVIGFDLLKYSSIENKRYVYVTGSVNNDKDLSMLRAKIADIQHKNGICGSVKSIINCTVEPDFKFPKISIPINLPEEEWALWGWKNYPSSEFAKQTTTNIIGAHQLLTNIFEQFSKSEDCSIVNFVSQYALKVPNQDLFKGFGKFIFKGPGYSASKAGLINYTQYLATIFKGLGVRANCIAIGSIENGQNPEFIKKYSANTLLGRMMRSEEIIPVVKFLVSDASSYMSGSCIVLDGGWTIK